MDLDLAQELIENGFRPVPPGHPTVLELIDNSQRRYIPLDTLDRKRNLCKWCWEKSTPSYRHKYCSPECRLSAEIFCYPQREYSKAYFLFHQKNKCANCDRTFGKEYDGHELRIEVDHMVPIFKGGQSLGHENLQLLCYQCHKIKSVEERKGWK
jgi:5-methylcytosine-specific restriction endonuclease McrA